MNYWSTVQVTYLDGSFPLLHGARSFLLFHAPTHLLPLPIVAFDLACYSLQYFLSRHHAIFVAFQDLSMLIADLFFDNVCHRRKHVLQCRTYRGIDRISHSRIVRILHDQQSVLSGAARMVAPGDVRPQKHILDVLLAHFRDDPAGQVVRVPVAPVPFPGSQTVRHLLLSLDGIHVPRSSAQPCGLLCLRRALLGFHVHGGLQTCHGRQSCHNNGKQENAVGLRAGHNLVKGYEKIIVVMFRLYVMNNS